MPTVTQETTSTEELLKCVWSHDGGCQARLPASLVAKSWQRESERMHLDEGFFHVPWRGGVWLAYGIRDSGVRGVYCPTHSAERAGHTSSIAPRRSSLAAGA